VIMIAVVANPVSVHHRFVAGADMDVEVLHVLTPGDRVLVEINGTLLSSKQQFPVVANEPWVVESNGDCLILRHSQIKNPLILPFQSLLTLQSGEPAVFRIYDRNLCEDVSFIVVKFIAWYNGECLSGKPIDRDAFVSLLKAEREDVLKHLISEIRHFNSSWGDRGLCRFALRSHVLLSDIKNFYSGNLEAVSKLSDDVILQVVDELKWIPRRVELDCFRLTTVDKYRADHRVS
jgi:hypothetical protein